jgi:MYXO-CTERM domain-containing protein
MKKLILAAAALMVSLAAYGQGTVSINNRVVPDVTARLISATDPKDGSSSSIGSPDWTVAFVGGAKGTAVSAMTPLLDATSNAAITADPLRGAAGSAAAGYFTPVTAIVPNVPAGSPADVAVIVKGPTGTTTLGPYSVTSLGGIPASGPPLTAPNLPMGTTPLVVGVPEPTTLALGALGLGALLVIRRRK